MSVAPFAVSVAAFDDWARGAAKGESLRYALTDGSLRGVAVAARVRDLCERGFVVTKQRVAAGVSGDARRFEYIAERTGRAWATGKTPRLKGVLR